MFFFRKKRKAEAEAPLVLEPAAVEPPVADPALPAADAPASEILRKRRRPASGNKTRLMGFEGSDGAVVDLFGGEKKEATNRIQNPVAVVMVTGGHGIGECFALKSGKSEIGRGEDQAVRLDFGDEAISRENHAAIVYDPKEHTFLLGHGGKSNIVRLNGKPVVSTSDLVSGDEIEIGETRMRFVAVCSKDFNWENAEQEEGEDDDDLEIA